MAFVKWVLFTTGDMHQTNNQGSDSENRIDDFMSSGVQTLVPTSSIHVSSAGNAAPNAFQSFMNAVGDAFANLGKAIMNHRVAVLTATAALALATIGYVFRESICSGAKASFEWVANLFKSENTDKSSANLSTSSSGENLDNNSV